MVRLLISHLQANGFQNITADLAGYTQPGKIVWTETQTGHIPDVTATHGGKLYIFEVEDSDCLPLDHTASQFKLFSAYAGQQGGQFVVLVPSASKMMAEQQLANSGATASIWTV